MCSGGLSQYPAKRRNGLSEVVLLHDDVRPDRLEKLALGNQLTGSFDEIKQRVEDLGCQGNQFTVRTR